MKRTLAFLIAVLLALSCHFSALAIDFSRYIIHDTLSAYPGPTFGADGSVFYRTYNETADRLQDHLLWYKHGTLLRDVTSQTLPLRQAIFLPGENDTCHVLLPATPSWNNAGERVPADSYLCVWNQSGLTEIKRFTEFWSSSSFHAAGGGFVAYDSQTLSLGVFLSDGTQLYQTAMPLKGQDDAVTPTWLYRSCGQVNGYLLLLFYTPFGETTYRLVCLRDGQVFWTRGENTMPEIFDPGNGSFYLTTKLTEDSYSPFRVTRLYYDGQEAASRTLSPSRLVLNASLSFSPQSDHLLLYGKAVANSRKIYNVYAMELDDSLNLLSLDVRTCDYCQDYEMRVYAKPGGSLCVFSMGNGNVPPVLVPFDDLPRASLSGLAWQ